MRYGLFPFRCEGAALVTRSACGAKMRDACFSDALVDLINGYIVEKEAISSRSRSRSRSFALFSSRSKLSSDGGRHTLLQKKPVHHVALVAGLTSMKLRVETMARIPACCTPTTPKKRRCGAESEARCCACQCFSIVHFALGLDGRRRHARYRRASRRRAWRAQKACVSSGPPEVRELSSEWSRRGATLLASP